MREICIEDFLMKCNPNHVERHSDSSDFEKPREIPIIASKGGNHRLLSGKTCNTKHEKPLSHYHVNKVPDVYNAVNFNKIKTTDIKVEQKILDPNIHMYKKSRVRTNPYCKQCRENISRNQGDQNSSCYYEHINSKAHLSNKAMPCLSTIFRFRNSYIKHMSSIEENQPSIMKNCDCTFCPNCERRQVAKCKRRSRYSAQPVYAVKEDVQGCPFKANNDSTPSTTPNDLLKNNRTDIYNNIIQSSESELENVKTKKYKTFLKTMKYGHEKGKMFDCLEYNSVKNQQQQYPSKLQIKPYQVFTSSSCQAKCSSSGSGSLAKMPSSSSAFWDFFAKKVKNKLQKPGISKSCDCIKPPEPCSPDNCEHFIATPENTDYSDADKGVPKVTNSSYQQTDDQSSQSSASYKKKKKEPKVICKCYPNKKRESKSNKSPLMMQQDDPKPCQEEHDAITRAISEKYNGEILCIHNPPCILINGCLNLPPPKSNIQADLWPVSQVKKSSFGQMYRKIKRSKQKNDQASQYHPPLIDLQEYLPEFKPEKMIQSICNHDPPCEVVHGCYKVQYDPKLQNSCVHVPMCEYFPVCLMSDKNKDFQNGSCTHNPKCTKLPICSRKYITLTAKQHIGTQVRKREKVICRHQPQCFMIPKCLIQAIRGNYIPYGAIPGCVHHPCCEMIPACCRKTTKEMVSVPSQYPNACRIV
ncbi:unnamed protein product [Euphydryas editha]|uniref:Uncharacterized protein n=1 Tax=Euphydryas editha TaxID=104508 RepID=A0AAU9TUL5_EUPED|nr:unnamed protein product [Euphydryas editha]